jgi:hypothetical protein
MGELLLDAAAGPPSPLHGRENRLIGIHRHQPPLGATCTSADRSGLENHPYRPESTVPIRHPLGWREPGEPPCRGRGNSRVTIVDERGMSYLWGSWCNDE